MRSRGVELDITGNPNENLSIIGGFLITILFILILLKKDMLKTKDW
jgi:hypothetical protein